MATQFPYQGRWKIGDIDIDARTMTEALSDHLTDSRKARIEAVIQKRSYDVVTVLDSIYDRGNASAVMRSMEGLGFGRLEMIETQTEFKAANRVTQGTEKWLDIRRWTEPAACVASLKKDGFQIIATHLDASVPLDSIDFSVPTAIVFGNERDGVCPEILERSDANVILPMNGFAQSYNISVAAAIMLYHIRSERKSMGPTDLNETERDCLRAEFYRRSVENSESILNRKLAET